MAVRTSDAEWRGDLRQGKGFAITRIELETEGQVPGLSAADFQTHAESAKANCPVSKALAGPTITLRARLAG